MNYIIFGPQGSGKGTQAEIICRKHKSFVHLSTGDILREEIKNKSKLGTLASKIMNNGNLVPDEIINKIVFKKVKQLNKEGKKIILDGYPRNINQAKFLINKNIPIKKIILLDIKDKSSIKRISSRYHCPVCGKNYNLIYESLKPKKDKICDKCNVELVQRQDDHKKAIKKRLKIYHQHTKPILDLFKDKIIHINGEQSIKKVSEDIINKIDD
jgi:adenylate kinase